MRAAILLVGAISLLIQGCSGVRRRAEAERKDLSSFFQKPEHYGALDACGSSGSALRRLSDRDGPDIWNFLGLCHFLAGSHAKAVFFFEMALERADGPSGAGALNNLGVVHAHLGHHLRAHSYFLRASRSDPALLIAGINLAHTYINFRRRGEARRILGSYADRHGGDEAFRRALERAGGSP